MWEDQEERLWGWLHMQIFTWVLEMELGSSTCCAPSAMQGEGASKPLFLLLFNRALCLTSFSDILSQTLALGILLTGMVFRGGTPPHQTLSLLFCPCWLVLAF